MYSQLTIGRFLNVLKRSKLVLWMFRKSFFWTFIVEVFIGSVFPTNNRTFSERSKNVPSWFFGRFVKTLYWTFFKRFVNVIKTN